jgi:hypothetical protein
MNTYPETGISLALLFLIFRIITYVIKELIAAGCFSMGAPCWFDVMGKLVHVRKSGIKPDKNN